MADDLFAALDSRGGAAAAVSARAWMQALLDAEAYDEFAATATH